MESPRSSLLSTLIMTLPLVVVPAIALLRPPAPDSGVSANELGATEDDDFFSELDVFEEAYTSDSADAPPAAEVDTQEQIEQLFAEEPQQPSGNVNSEAPAFESGDPFLPRGAPPATTPAQPPGRGYADPEPSPDRVDPGRTAAVSDAQRENQLLSRLSQLGVRKTMWFQAGPSPQIGFVAFLPGRDPKYTYRFESVSAGRVEALQDVLRQLTAWHAARQTSGAPNR